MTLGPNSHVQTWELDHKEGWVQKSWCFWTVVLEKTFESPLGSVNPKEINPEYSLEELMLKLQYFGHIMQRANSLENTLMLGKIEGRRRIGWQSMRWLSHTTKPMGLSLGKLWEMVKNKEACPAAVHRVAKSQIWLSNWTTRHSNNPLCDGNSTLGTGSNRFKRHWWEHKQVSPLLLHRHFFPSSHLSPFCRITTRWWWRIKPSLQKGKFCRMMWAKNGCYYTATAKSLQSCLTLCDPIDGSPPGSPVPGILQARILEWVAISFSNAWKWKMKSLSRVRLLATPWTAAYKAPPSMGFFQARVLEWGAIAFSGCYYEIAQIRGVP